MKLFIKTVIFHFICILIFAFFYYNLKDKFQSQQKQEITTLDYLLLRTTIQAGVGFTDIYPITFYSKLLIIIQQMILIMTHVFTVYIFTL